ncbi:MAG TPA: hypothetical protein VN132_06515 [Bdellovibrio sp.]|nr:hypothetical protein [Bdellovibrio sp.]
MNQFSKVIFMLLLFSSLSRAESISATSFAQSVQVQGSQGHEEFLKQFLSKIADASYLFEKMPIAKSSAERLVVLPSEKYEGSDPAFLLNEKTLLIGALSDCENVEESKFMALSLHEFAHSVFTPNFYYQFSLKAEEPIEERFNAKAITQPESEKELDKLATLRDLTAPFDEVFADTFAVIAMNDPSSVANELNQCGRAGENRDFSKIYPAATWDEGRLRPFYLVNISQHPWEEKSPEDQGILFDASPHDVLSPLRTQVWQTYSSLDKNIGSCRSGDLVMSTLFEASVQIVKQMRDKKMKYREWFGMSKPALNEQVIQRFKELINLNQSKCLQ